MFQCTLSKLCFFRSRTTELVPKFGQFKPALRNGRPPRPPTLFGQITEFYGGKGYPHHTVSDHFEKPARSLSPIHVHQGAWRLFGGKCCDWLMFCMWLITWPLCDSTVHQAENLEGHSRPIGHRGVFERSLHSQEALRQKSFAFWMLLRQRRDRSGTHFSSGTLKDRTAKDKIGQKLVKFDKIWLKFGN